MASSNKTWADGQAPTCEAADLNGFQNENNNLIASAGQALNTGDNDQTAKSVANYSASGDFYNDTGAADAYVLGTTGSFKAPTSYVDGVRARFRAGNTNTGASTVNIAGIGVKSIKTPAGNDPAAGKINQADEVTLSFDLSNDWFVLQEVNNDGVLPGVIQMWAGATVPAGYLDCDGAAVSRTTFADLFTAISVGWGIGDAATTFNVPDLRGTFPRFVDGGAGIDPDAATRTANAVSGNAGDLVGSEQAGQNEAHVHEQNSTTIVTADNDIDSVSGGTVDWEPYSSFSGTLNVESSGGTETRPINSYVRAIIKF